MTLENYSFRTIGLFVLPALVALVAVAGLIAWKQELFASRTPIFVFTDSALGVTKGIPVKVFGLTVGSVADIAIVPAGPGVKGQVRIRLDIASEHLQHIARNSTARLMREAIVGQSLIEILPGEPPGRPVARNEVIQFERGKTLGELSEELNRSLSPVLGELKDAIHEMRRPDGRFVKSAERIGLLLEELPHSNRKLQSVLGAAERTLGRVDTTVEHADEALSTISGKAEAALDTMGGVAAQFATAMPTILHNVDRAAAAMAHTAQGAARITDDASKRVPLLLDGSESVIRDASGVVSGARNAWPLRHWVTPGSVTTLSIDSDPR
jgi:phospholipid/cholesterol/gamma-HCH transport system substrate-binding protein